MELKNDKMNENIRLSLCLSFIGRSPETKSLGQILRFRKEKNKKREN